MDDQKLNALDAFIEQEGVDSMLFAIWIVCIRNRMRKDSDVWQQNADIIMTAAEGLMRVHKKTASDKIFKQKQERFLGRIEGGAGDSSL